MTSFAADRSSIHVLLGTVAGAGAVGAAFARQPLLALVSFGLAATVVAVLAWPEGATHAVLFLTFISAAAVAVRFHGAPLVVGLVIPLLLVVPVAHHVIRGEQLIIPTPFLLMLALLLVQIASTAISLDIDTGWEKTKNFAFEGVLIYFLLVNAIRSTATLRRAIWVLVGSGAALSAITVFQHVTGDYSKPFGGFAQVGREYFTGRAAEPRLAGPLGDPNYYAQILLVVIPLSLLLAWSERSPIRRTAALAATASAVFAVALTASRGAAVAFLIILGLMRLFGYLRGRHLTVIVTGLVALLVVVPTYRDRVATLTGVASATSEASRDDSGADQSVRSRSTEMMAAALVLTDHPLLGVGPDQFGLYYQEYAGRLGGEVHDRNRSGARAGEVPEREAHNMLLGVAADLGLAGLGIFLALVYVTIRDLLRVRRRGPTVDPALVQVATGLLLGVIAYLVTGLFLTLAFERYFWLMLALAGAVATIAAREQRPVHARVAHRGLRHERSTHELGDSVELGFPRLPSR